MPTFDRDGVRIAYDDEGPHDGVPVVLVHGWTADRHRWDAQVAALRGAHRCVRLDLPGHGESDPDPERSLDALVGAVADLIAHLGLDRPVVVGHSMGGMVTMELALRVPTPVRGAVLVGTTSEMVFSRARGALIALSRLLPYRVFVAVNAQRAFSRATPRAQVRAFHRAAMTLRRDVVLDYYRAMTGFSVADRLGAVDVPVLVVHGYRDVQFPVAQALRIATAVPGAVLEVVDAGHEAPLEAPAAVAGAISRFVAGLG